MAKEIYTEYDKSMFFKPGEEVYTHISTSLDKCDNIIHKHKFIEMVYVISGNGMHWINGLNYPVSKGDLMIIDYGTPHGFFYDSETEENFVTYDLLFTPAFLGLPDNNEHFSSLADSFLFESFKASPLFDTELKLINNTSHDKFYEHCNNIYA